MELEYYQKWLLAQMYKLEERVDRDELRRKLGMPPRTASTLLFSLGLYGLVKATDYKGKTCIELTEKGKVEAEKAYKSFEKSKR